MKPESMAYQKVKFRTEEFMQIIEDIEQSKGNYNHFSIINQMLMRDKIKSSLKKTSKHKMEEKAMFETESSDDEETELSKDSDMYKHFLKEFIAKQTLADANSIEAFTHLFPYYDYRNEFEATKADLLFDSFLSDYVLIG
jgi:hypothetical protein